jgi:hypothetical protein
VATDTLFVDRPIVRRDTVTVERAVTRTVFERVTDTVRVEIPVPRDLVVAGVITPTPVRFDRGDVLLTYYSPGLGAWAQDRYSIPPARREAYFAPLVALSPFHPTRLSALGFEGGYRWNALTGYVRAEAIAEGGVYLTAGLRVAVFHKTYR